MKTTIKIPPSGNIPLQSIRVGRASSFDADIVGAPMDVENVQAHIGKPGEEGTFTPVVCTPMPDGSWRLYASGLNFPDAGEAAYHLTGVDAQGNSRWLGSGTLTVIASVLTSSSASIVPADTYLRNPATGLWHKLTATVEDGVITPVISAEGITR